MNQYAGRRLYSWLPILLPIVPSILLPIPLPILLPIILPILLPILLYSTLLYFTQTARVAAGSFECKQRALWLWQARRPVPHAHRCHMHTGATCTPVPHVHGASTFAHVAMNATCLPLLDP